MHGALIQSWIREPRAHVWPGNKNELIKKKKVVSGQRLLISWGTYKNCSPLLSLPDPTAANCYHPGDVSYSSVWNQEVVCNL